jgi:methionyl-tRNA formyltransferase
MTAGPATHAAPLAYFWGDDAYSLDAAVESFRRDPVRFPDGLPERWRVRGDGGDGARVLAELTERLAVLGADLLVETLAGLDQIVPREQDHAAATLAPKLSRQDGELSWELPAEEIDRRVRAFTPWPGVTLPFANARVKVLRGRPLSGSGTPGEVLAAGGEGVEVACGRGSYLLREVQLPGGRPLPAAVLVAGSA